MWIALAIAGVVLLGVVLTIALSTAPRYDSGDAAGRFTSPAVGVAGGLLSTYVGGVV